MTVLDLFACAGGTTTGIAMLDRKVIGIDHDRDACATHAAAGHPTIRTDLTRPVPVTGEFEMVWASPPCTAFSMAGKGEGRKLADVLVSRILTENWEPLEGHDPAVWLVLPTMAAILDLAPVAVAMENVPPTMPVMQACALVLRRHGYHTAVGILSAETFGVAQTRKRAFLIANRTRGVTLPEPTHQAYDAEVDEAQGSLFGEPLLPWISMAEALGWGLDNQPAPTQVGDPRLGATSFTRAAIAAKLCVQSDQANAAERTTDEPAPAVAFGHNLPRDGAAWTFERPSTTIVSSFRPDVVASPHSKGSNVSRQDRPGSISVTVAEAARLQAFPNGYPWAGSRTSVFRQIGNAVPPPVAAAVAGAALGLPREQIKAAVFAYLDDLYSVPLDRQETAPLRLDCDQSERSGRIARDVSEAAPTVTGQASAWSWLPGDEGESA